MDDIIKVETEVVDNYVSNLQRENNELHTNVYYDGNVSIKFVNFNNCGLLENYPKSLLSNIGKIYKYAKDLEQETQGYSAALVDIESNLKADVSKDIDLDLKQKKLSGSHHGGGSNNDGPGVTPGIRIVPTVAEIISNSLTSVDNSLYKNPSEIDSTASSLLKGMESNLTIDQLVSGEHNDVLSIVISKANNISMMILLMTKMSDTEMQQYLSELYSGKYDKILNQNSIPVLRMKEYLERVAENNNITIQELLSDSKHSRLLKISQIEFNVLLASKSTDIDTGKITNQLNEFSKQQNLTSNDILSGNHNEMLTKHIGGYNDITEISSVLNRMNGKELHKYLNELLDGKYTNMYNDNSSLSVLIGK